MVRFRSGGWTYRWRDPLTLFTIAVINASLSKSNNRSQVYGSTCAIVKRKRRPRSNSIRSNAA